MSAETPPSGSLDRWIVSGRLVTVSSMEVRTGDIETDATRPRGQVPGLGEPEITAQGPDILAIELDANRRPVIPATAMKGLVRATLAVAFGDDQQDAIIRLLGDRPDKRADALRRVLGGSNPMDAGDEDDDTRIPIGGSAEFRNLPMESPDPDPPARLPVLGKTVIHDGTGAAQDGLLRHNRIVPENTAFRFEIVIDRACAADVALLHHVLAGFNAGHGSAFGGRKRVGQGRIRLEPASLSIRHLDAARAAAWLADPSDVPWQDYATEIAPESLPVPPPARPQARAVPLTLQVDGFFLVTAEQPREKESGQTAGANARKPRTIQRNGKSCPLLPGESLNGVLRAHAMRIWRTLANSLDATVKADHPVSELFGAAERGGRLALSDFVDEAAPPMRGHEMVAIDRFHGASAGSAKFNVLAFESPRLTGTIRLDAAQRTNPRVSGKATNAPASFGAALSLPAFGLLVLLLRDLADGHLAAGHGTRKGYGVLMLEEDWQDIIIAMAADLPWDLASDIQDPTARGQARIKAAVQALRDAHAVRDHRTKAEPPADPTQPPRMVAGQSMADSSTHFLNAYHFVPVEDGVAPEGPDGSLSIIHAKDDRFGLTPETARDGHAIYADGTWSGHVECGIEALQPFIVGNKRHGGDQEGRTDKRKYAVLEPFLLGGQPAISATSLKGMISAIIESVSRSALRVLANELLAVRVQDGPQAKRERLNIGGVHNLFRAGDTARENLLPMNTKRTLITPAERMFGFVSADAPPKEDPTTQRIRAVAGRLRFSSATLVAANTRAFEADSDFNGETYGSETVGQGFHRLRELSGPLKTAQDPERDPARNASAAMYYRRRVGEQGPIPRAELQRATPGDLLPQGRKFYLHHPPGGDPWLTGRTPAQDQLGTQPAAGRKTATKLVASGQTFRFRVAFDNLSNHELGLLLFALKPSPAFRHKLGLGKPLGLGSVHLVPRRLAIIDRYRRYAEEDPLTPAPSRDLASSIDAFIAQARTHIEETASQALAALLAIGETHAFQGGQPSGLRVLPVPMEARQFRNHGTQGDDEDKLFRWFQNNTKASKPQALAPIVDGARQAREAIASGRAVIPPLRVNEAVQGRRSQPRSVPQGESGQTPSGSVSRGRGTLLSFNLQAGIGAIRPDDNGPDISLSFAALRQSDLTSLPPDLRLSYDVASDSNGQPTAINVTRA